MLFGLTFRWYVHIQYFHPVAKVYKFFMCVFPCITQEHMIQSEVSILRRMKHPNIVLLIEEMDTQSELFLVMELVKVRHVSRFSQRFSRQVFIVIFC